MPAAGDDNFCFVCDKGGEQEKEMMSSTRNAIALWRLLSRAGEDRNAKEKVA
jgi:hypothetical protein